VFAATVVRFLSAPRHRPRARLDILLARCERQSAMPYHMLQQLYVQVLKASVRPDQQEEVEKLCKRVRNVVGTIVAA
jgi:hypothetical protein